jgi:hypothetical protein
MKRKKALLLSALLLIVCIGGIAFAHQGRTDANGGHRDNNNQSGLGWYHYHCDGYPAHLHTNGVCPYSSNTNQSSSPVEYSGGYSDEYGVEYDYGYEDGYDKGYDEGHSEGYNEGYDDGYDKGHEVGYDYGYDEGKDVGYEEGYNDGDTNGKEESAKTLGAFISLSVVGIVLFALFKTK